MAHTTLVVGDGVHACAAAVNAVTLADLDSSRARVVVAMNISSETREILEHGWQLMEPAGSLEPLVRKAAILLLPHERALFWDTDHMLLPDPRRSTRLEALWRFHPEVELVAAGESYSRRGHWCFNSGLMLFTPNASRHRAYVELVRSGAKPERCWNGGDQGPLNEVYRENSDKWLLDGHMWNLQTPQGIWRERSLERCPGDAHLATAVDSYHFFGRAAPWGSDADPN